MPSIVLPTLAVRVSSLQSVWAGRERDACSIRLRLCGNRSQTSIPILLEAWSLPKVRYHSLRWILRRKDAFAFLLSDSSFASGSKEMSDSELKLIEEIADSNSQEGLKFWATCLVVECLSDWGVSTSVWFHGCSCSHHENEKAKTACKLKGRRAVELADGAWHHILNALRDVKLSTGAISAISKLSASGDKDFASSLLTSFQECKSMMLYRSMQAWGFWESLPFSILKMCKHIVYPDVGESVSREHARQLMLSFDSAESKTSMGFIPWHFFGHQRNRGLMLDWIKGGPLAEDLEFLLIGYATSLCVMQRLEARHHLVNQAISHGRASHPPSTMANLRRRLNQDCQDPRFRELLPELLNKFSDLVPQQWNSRKELLEIVYGHGLTELHPDTTFEEQQMNRHSALTDGLVQARSTDPKLVPCPG